MSAAEELKAAAADYARHNSEATQVAWRDQQASVRSHASEAAGSWSGSSSTTTTGQTVSQTL